MGFVKGYKTYSYYTGCKANAFGILNYNIRARYNLNCAPFLKDGGAMNTCKPINIQRVLGLKAH